MTLAPERRATYRNVGLLSGSWALAISGNILLVNVAALVGHQLAADKSLATLPAAMLWVGTATATVPASFLMRRIGRRRGFMAGALIGAGGAALAAYAVYVHSFALLCLGVGLIGAYSGFNFYLRFAAAEVAPEAFRSRAIALVLAGGVVSAVLGPRLAMVSTDWFPPWTFMGPFVAIAGLAGGIFLLAAFVDIPKPSAHVLRRGRRLADIVRQPSFVVAALGGLVAYGVMILVMSVTPLAMVASEHAFAATAFVFQWHVLGMYLPSFFTGHLIRRFGTLNVMVWGAVCMILCAGVAASGVGLVHFWVALTLLGLGWNFLFIGATTLLTETHTVDERAKTQAVNEFLVFGVAALCSFLSGNLHYHFGWQALNLTALAPVLAALAATLWLARQRRLAYAVKRTAG